MKNENFAERLFCDLKNAGIKIEKAIYIQEGARFGQLGCAQYVLYGNCENTYDTGNGPGIDMETKLIKSYTQAYEDFLNLIKNFIENDNVKFYSMAIPNRSVMEAKLEEFDKVVTRYIKDYYPMTDMIYERWDIIIEKVNSNV